MTAATAASMRRGESLCSLASRAPRESSRKMALATWRASPLTAVVGQLAVDDQRVEPGGGRAHAGRVLEELMHRHAVAVEHFQRALPAVGVGGDLEHAPAQARRPDGVLDGDHGHAPVAGAFGRFP